VKRSLVAVGVLALLATAGPRAAIAGSPPPSTTDTWTVAGCEIGLTNSFVPARKHVGAHWHTEGAVSCTGAEVDAEARIDLTRNRVAVANSFARATCGLTTANPCVALQVSHDTAYHSPTADWRARLVLFIRGPLSVPAWIGDYCVLDIPTFKTICTFPGAVIRR
jgi:hypothetical protein